MNPPRIAVGCICFQDVQGVERLIESCYQQVDYVFIIDGKFKDYESIYPFSTDGLDYLLDKYHNVVYENCANLLEYQKRSTYLELCREYNIDFLIIIDSDEYVHPQSDWDAFREELFKLRRGHIFNLKNYTQVDDGGLILPFDQPRLWREPGKLEYKNKAHYQFGLIGKDSVITAKETLYGIKLIHDPHLRPEHRTEQHDKYIQKLVEYEKYKQLMETNKEKAQREYVVWNS